MHVFFRFITIFLSYLLYDWKPVNAFLCIPNLPHGWISLDCYTPRENCTDWGCYAGYHTPYQGALVCNENLTWTPNDPCVRNDNIIITPKCSSVISDGYISRHCSRTVWSSCSYYCSAGCRRTQTNLLCTATHGRFHWENVNNPKACDCTPSTISTRCPSEIPNGKIPPYCTRSRGSTCYDYTCNNGYYKSFFSLDCDSHGSWITDEPCHLLKNGEDHHVDIYVYIGTSAGILLLVCLFGWVCMCGRRTNSGTDSTDNTCRTNDLNDMHLSESDTLGVTNQGYNTNPPAYDSVAIVKLDESALPPTYAIVTAHPSEFSVCVA